MKKKFYFTIITLFFLFVGCGQSERVDQLSQRINELEQQLSETNGQTLSMLKTGTCSLTNIEEDSARLVCGDGTSFIIRNGKDGNSCTVSQTAVGSQISCTDGTSATIVNGTDGKNGTNGHSCSVTELENGTQVSCTDGSAAFIAHGKDGTSCSVTQSETGVKLECQDGTTAEILHGKDGNNGESCKVSPVDNVGALVECGETSAMVYNGADGISQVMEVINPCGEGQSFSEVLLRLANGTLIAHFASEEKHFLTIIGPGNYQTTDGYGCNFTVLKNGEVVSN